jgi:hypothetical protein
MYGCSFSMLPRPVHDQDDDDDETALTEAFQVIIALFLLR